MEYKKKIREKKKIFVHNLNSKSLIKNKIV